MRGPEQVAQELIRSAVGTVFDKYFKNSDLDQVVQYFELGGTLKLAEEASAKTVLKERAAPSSWLKRPPPRPC
jgi:magnesium chelatase subunit I